MGETQEGENGWGRLGARVLEGARATVMSVSLGAQLAAAFTERSQEGGGPGCTGQST